MKNIFNGKRELFGNIFKDFCLSRRDINFFEDFINNRKLKLEYIKNRIQPFRQPYIDSGIDIKVFEKSICNLAERFDNDYFKTLFQTKAEPNGSQTFPDHAIFYPPFGWQYIDTKCVICKKGKPQYGCQLGNVRTIVDKFREDNWETNQHTNALISIVYYSEETGEILDSLYIPITYMMGLNPEKNQFTTNGNKGLDGNITARLPLLTDNRKILSFKEKDDIVKKIIFSNIYNW